MKPDQQTSETTEFVLEDEISQWQTALRGKPGVSDTTVDEMTDHLATHIESLQELGLSDEESFLVAIKRMGSQSEASRELADVHSALTWKTLTQSTETDPAANNGWVRMLTFGLGLGAVLWVYASLIVNTVWDRPGLTFLKVLDPIQLGALGLAIISGGVSAYLGRRNGLKSRQWFAVGGIHVTLIVTALLLMSSHQSQGFGAGFSKYTHDQFELLMPAGFFVLAWVATSYAYTRGKVTDTSERINFVRYTGEWFTYFALICAGTATIHGLFVAMFAVTDVDFNEHFLTGLYSMIAGVALVACTWLVESKRRVIENILPVLTKLFSPFLAVMLIVFLAIVPFLGNLVDMDRGALMVFTASLAIVYGLVLYSWSARDNDAPTSKADWVQVTLIAAALAVNTVVLAAMALRISELGVTPNRLVTLVANVLLTANLGGTLYLYVRCIKASSGFAAIERWQARFLTYYVVWAAVVAVVLPWFFLTKGIGY